MLAVIAEEELFPAALDLTAVLRLEHLKLRLQHLRKALAAVIGIGEEHLCAAVFRIGKLILMNRDADGVLRFVENREAVIHVGAFLVRDALDPFVMDGAVGIPRDMHLEAGNLKQRTEVEQDAEVDPFLRDAVCGGAAAVDAAVRRINLN